MMDLRRQRGMFLVPSSEVGANTLSAGCRTGVEARVGAYFNVTGWDAGGVSHGSRLFHATTEGWQRYLDLRMVYPEDYCCAHRRHWKDAEVLFKQRRWANADQLYGLSAECGLKALMPDVGMPVEYKHLEVIWPDFAQFATAAQGRVNARYVALLPSGTPFSGWSVQNRYAHSRHFPKSVVKPHRKAARAVRQMVDVAIQDGIQL